MKLDNVWPMHFFFLWPALDNCGRIVKSHLCKTGDVEATFLFLTLLAALVVKFNPVLLCVFGF